LPLTTRSHLIIGAEVAAFLGPEALAQLRDNDAFTGYTCPVCDSHGTLRDPSHPATVVAWHYLPSNVTLVQYVHASCSPSTLLTVNAHPASGLDLSGTSAKTPKAQSACMSAIQRTIRAGRAAINAARLKFARCSLSEGGDTRGERRAAWIT
jgi:hypothetical protein